MKIVPVVRQVMLKDFDEDVDNMKYWLSRPPHERIAAVTRLIQSTLKPGERMDRTHVVQRMLHP